MSQARCAHQSCSRRNLLAGGAGLGAGVVLLAGCGSGDDPGTASGSGSSEESTEGGSAGGGEQQVPVADVPVGGGVVIGESELVVAQPEEGVFKAYSAICTHQGCVVAGVNDGVIDCRCHGSEFSAEDGSVLGGPAPEGLTEIPVTVDGDMLTVG
ncbi:MAG: Rieske (2Fe-2S) protein [Nocardioides sp.]|nr:Rieske (2Fe-2S) protein [Nocardioides sp.]MDP3891714.1 Rieske (2Fe-2S) protein [Nocardioides sp.]